MPAESQKNILFIEEQPNWQFIFTTSVQYFRDQVKIRFVQTVRQAEEVLLQTSDRYDLIICDHSLKQDQSEIDLWKKCQNQYKDIPFLMVSSLSDIDFYSLLKEQLGISMASRKDCIPDELEFIWNNRFADKTSTRGEKNIFLTFVLTLGIAGNLIAMGLNHVYAAKKPSNSHNIQQGSLAQHTYVKNMIPVETKKILQHILSQSDRIKIW